MLKVSKVTKRYKDVIALKDVSFKMNKGVYALLGPNGAGKSTLMNIMTQQLDVSRGQIYWNDQLIEKLNRQYYSLLGYAPQQQGLYEEMSGLRFLTYMALLKDIPKIDISKEVERVASLVNMQPYLSRKCKTYSGGMKQRILVAQALLGKPQLLLFDEPTAGLDPKERVSLRNVFERLGKDHILMIATHVVSDVESIANEVIFLKKGQIIDHGQVRDLIDRYHVSSLEDVYLQLFKDDVDDFTNHI